MLRWAKRRRQLPAGPVLRAVLENGETFDDPSEDHLFVLLEDVEVGDQAFLIVERPADASGSSYVQVQKDERGHYRVERREGSVKEHWMVVALDMRAAHRIVTDWAFGSDQKCDAPEWSRMTFS